MAMQISTNKLSPEAKKAVDNANNKSQFLRDAIEYYVKEHSSQKNIENELNEIKSLLLKLTSADSNKGLLEKKVIQEPIVEVEVKQAPVEIIDAVKVSDPSEYKTDNTKTEINEEDESLLLNSISAFF